MTERITDQNQAGQYLQWRLFFNILCSALTIALLLLFLQLAIIVFICLALIVVMVDLGITFSINLWLNKLVLSYQDFWITHTTLLISLAYIVIGTLVLCTGVTLYPVTAMATGLLIGIKLLHNFWQFQHCKKLRGNQPSLTPRQLGTVDNDILSQEKNPCSFTALEKSRSLAALNGTNTPKNFIDQESYPIMDKADDAKNPLINDLNIENDITGNQSKALMEHPGVCLPVARSNDLQKNEVACQNIKQHYRSNESSNSSPSNNYLDNEIISNQSVDWINRSPPKRSDEIDRYSDLDNNHNFQKLNITDALIFIDDENFFKRSIVNYLVTNYAPILVKEMNNIFDRICVRDDSTETINQRLKIEVFALLISNINPARKFNPQRFEVIEELFEEGGKNDFNKFLEAEKSSQFHYKFNPALAEELERLLMSNTNYSAAKITFNKGEINFMALYLCPDIRVKRLKHLLANMDEDIKRDLKQALQNYRCGLNNKAILPILNILANTIKQEVSQSFDTIPTPHQPAVSKRSIDESNSGKIFSAKAKILLFKLKSAGTSNYEEQKKLVKQLKSDKNTQNKFTDNKIKALIKSNIFNYDRIEKVTAPLILTDHGHSNIDNLKYWEKDDQNIQAQYYLNEASNSNLPQNDSDTSSSAYHKIQTNIDYDEDEYMKIDEKWKLLDKKSKLLDKNIKALVQAMKQQMADMSNRGNF